MHISRMLGISIIVEIIPNLTLKLRGYLQKLAQIQQTWQTWQISAGNTNPGVSRFNIENL